MLPKKSVQREGGGKKDTTAAVLRYRDTADASHTKGVDEEVDGFIIIDGMQACSTAVQMLISMQDLEMRNSLSSIVGRAHETRHTPG